MTHEICSDNEVQGDPAGDSHMLPTGQHEVFQAWSVGWQEQQVDDASQRVSLHRSMFLLVPACCSTILRVLPITFRSLLLV